MKAAEKLYKEYQEQLRQLQEECPHTDQTDWMEEWWALGHSTGRRVKICTNCNKVLAGKRCCAGCGKEWLEEQLQQGDGRVRPWGSWYCAQCYPKAIPE